MYIKFTEGKVADTIEVETNVLIDYEGRAANVFAVLRGTETQIAIGRRYS